MKIKRVEHVAIAVSFAAQIPLVLVPALRSMFGTVPLPAAAWAWVAASVALAWWLAQSLSRLLWSEKRFRALS